MVSQKVSLFFGGVGLCLGWAVAQPTERSKAFLQAQGYTQRQVWDSALLAWRSLLNRETDSGAVALMYQQLGYIALHKGDSAEALRLWETALRFWPEYRPALQNYQWLRQRLRRPPPPTPPYLYRYTPPPPLSEKAPPTVGELPLPRKLPEPQWLPAARLQR